MEEGRTSKAIERERKLKGDEHNRKLEWRRKNKDYNTGK